MITRLSVAVFTIVFCLFFAQFAYSELPEPIATAENYMQAKDYQKAIDTLSRSLPHEYADYGAWLTSLAQYKKGNKADAVRSCNAFIASYPASSWLSKVKFLLADIYISNKDYIQAAKVYESFSKNLLSSERKERIARVYMDYAKSLSYNPKPEELDLPKPDYNKAFLTYAEVAKLEIGDDIRDEVEFRMGLMKLLALDFYQAKERYIAYLKDFDPDYTAMSTGSVSADRSKVAGKHVFDARLNLAETKMRLSDFAGARTDFTDLARLIEKKQFLTTEAGKKYHRLALRRLPFTYSLPNPDSDFDLENGIRLTDSFLALYKDDPIAPTLSRNKAFSLMNRGKTDDAIKALKDLADKKGFIVSTNESPEEKSYRESIGIKLSAEEQFEAYKKEAMLMIGSLLASQKKYGEAIDVYSSYIAQFPNGEHWTSAQSGIIDAQYRIGEELVRSKKYTEAEDAWNDFLSRNPLDERSRRILFTLAQVTYEEGKKSKSGGNNAKAKSEFSKALAGFQRLVSKYPRTEESSLAQLRAGEILEIELMDLGAALIAYRNLTWGRYANEAAQRVSRMVNKDLEVRTERIFRTNEQAKVKVRTRNIESLTLSAYKLDLEAYFRKTHGIRAIEQLDLSLIAPDKSWTVKVPNYVKYLGTDQEIAIPMEGPGAYAVNVASEELEATTLVIKSDIDIIVKSSKKDVLVFVENMLTGSPVTGAKIILTDGVKVLAEEQSGSNGIMQKFIPVLASGDRIEAFASIRGSMAATGLSIAALGTSIGLSPKGYVYTDLPAYKPGQSVNIKGIIRDVENGSYSLPRGKNAKYVLSVSDPRGKTIYSEQVMPGEFGTISASVQIGEKAATGSYIINLSNIELARYFSGRFTVEAYKLEKIKLESIFDKPVYFKGEEVKVRFKATYYYGQPAADMELRYVTPMGLSFTAKTDANGILDVSFDSTPFRPGSMLVFSCTIVSENVTIRSQVPIASQEFFLSLSASRKELRAGESVEVLLVATDAAGTRIAREAEISMYERIAIEPDPLLASVPWLATDNDSPEGEVLLETKKIRTDDKGIARVVFTATRGGLHPFRVKSTDRFGNIILAETSVFVSGDDDSIAVRIFANRNLYAVGDEDSISVYSRITHPSTALITFEGEGIISYSVITLKEKENMLRLAIDNSHFPNFVFSVAVMDGNMLHTAAVPFEVERGLVIKIKPDKESYAPGERANIAIEVTDQKGKPAKAEISMAIVNDALLALYADNSPGIKDYFEQGVSRKAEMETTSSCSFSYQGITKAVLREIVEEDLRLYKKSETKDAGKGFYESGEMLRDEMTGGEGQSNIPMERESKEKNLASDSDTTIAKDTTSDQARKETDTASIWIASIVTDANGKAQAAITVPDLISSYRIRIKGATIDSLVGQEDQSFFVRKDFFASIKMSASVQEKDSIAVIGRIHNSRDYTGNASAILTVKHGDSEVAKFEMKTRISGSGIKEILFPRFIVPSVRELTISLEVKADNGNNDALARVVNVRPWGLPFEVRRAGTASDSATIFALLPTDRTYESRRMDISVYPAIEMTLVDTVLRNLGSESYKSRYVKSIPGGPGSQLIATISLLSYLKDRSPNRDTYGSLTIKARELAGELVSTQSQAGSWSLDDGSEYIALSSEAYRALALAMKQGITVDERVMSSAKDYLTKAFSSIDQNDNESKAIILHALASTRDADFSFVNRLYRSRQELSEAACALVALSLAALDRKDMARDMLRTLDATMKTVELSNGSAAYWSGTGNRPWLRNPVETTALVALAYQEIEPDNQVIQKAIAYLMNAKTGSGFFPDKALGSAMEALTRYFGKTKPRSSDYTLEIFVNDTSVGRLNATKTLSGSSPALSIEVPSGILIEKENKIRFAMSGTGEYFYSVGLVGFSRDMKDPVSWQEPAIDGKRYIHEPLRYNGKIIGYSSQEIRELEYDQTMDVRLDFSSGYIGRYLVLEEFIPTGCTLLPDTIRGDFSDYDLSDGKIVFYFKPDTYLSEISYSIAPYVPGTYEILPPVLRDAFDPAEMRIGKPYTMTVLPAEEKSKETYVMNDEELFGMGKALYEDGKSADALVYLEKLYAHDRGSHQPEVAQKLLWIRTEDEYYDPQKLVEYFEILKEKYPELSIPFAKILAVGKAYADMKEHERSYLVYRAIIDSSFARDSQAGGYLERSGEFSTSIDYMEKLILEYPDTNPITSAMFALSQELYFKASDAEYLSTAASGTGGKAGGFTRDRILEMARDELRRFMTLYPDNELSDDAAFTTLNITLDEKNYDKTIVLAREYQSRYKDSIYLSNYQFMEALAHFSLRKYDDAVKIADIVSRGTSDNNTLATYILGQIYHARRDPAKALSYYKSVSPLFEDAAGAIDFFESKFIGIDEYTIFSPGEKPAVDLTYKNIKEASVQVYKVDLMKLLLQEKNLSRIAGVNLAGITPFIEKKVQIGNGLDYETKTRELGLDIKDEGAYLIVIRGDDLFTSGLVLCTPLSIVIQEEPDSGRIRINVYDKVKKIYPDSVHVKAIGSDNTEFVSGDTDMRGIFVADGIRGVPTVIARDSKNRYAFYRGTAWLGGETYDTESEGEANKPDFDNQYRGNLDKQQRMMNDMNRANLDNLYEQDVKGVQVQQAY